MAVLGKVERTVGFTKRGLEITQECIGRVELLQSYVGGTTAGSAIDSLL